MMGHACPAIYARIAQQTRITLIGGSPAEDWGMARQYRRISADCHLDMLWLPPDLFTSNASSKMKDLMPYVAENADGVKRWTDNNGAEYGLCGGVGATGTPHVPGKQLRADKKIGRAHV